MWFVLYLVILPVSAVIYGFVTGAFLPAFPEPEFDQSEVF